MCRKSRLHLRDTPTSLLAAWGDWDPIGVADIVDDEHDMYIGHIRSLLATDAAEQALPDHLLWIELERMGLTGTPMDQLLRVAANLRNLPLPSVENHGPTARKKTTSRALLPEHVPKLSAS